jgi:hypothetical protein
VKFVEIVIRYLLPYIEGEVKDYFKPIAKYSGGADIVFFVAIFLGNSGKIVR